MDFAQIILSPFVWLLTVSTNGLLRLLGIDPDAEDSEVSEEEIRMLVDSGSGDAPVVTRTVYPNYRGALVVCQGGDRAEVKLAVTEAVAALTGLSADRITVAKSQ